MSFLQKLVGRSEKRFKIPGDQIKQLIPKMGGCLATDHIVVDGKKVGYMYRGKSAFEADSGWRFFSGEESQAYIDDSTHTGIFEVNTVANYDPAIVPYLDAEEGTAFGRVGDTERFEQEAFSPPED